MAELDHLVYAVTDLPGAVDDLAARLGVRPSPGGRHVGRGTRNHLLSFDDGAYLEVIGIDPEQPAPDGPRPFGLDDLATHGLVTHRLVTWAVRVPDIEAAIAAARAGGYDPGRAQSMSRATPDGGLLSWKLTEALVLGDGLVPFLIEWGDTTHPSATATGGGRLASFAGQHPQPGPIVDALGALGALDRRDGAIAVTAGPVPRLAAEVRGPAGSVTLT